MPVDCDSGVQFGDRGDRSGMDVLDCALRMEWSETSFLDSQKTHEFSVVSGSDRKGDNHEFRFVVDDFPFHPINASALGV